MATWTQVMEQVVRERRPALVGYAYLLTGSRADAEDIVHDAIVRTFARGRVKRDVHVAEAYIRKAIANAAINRARHGQVVRARRGAVSTPEARPSHAEAVQGQADLEAALAKLTPRERAVVVLRYVDDLPYSMIASHLSLHEGTVKRYLSNAGEKLRALLGEDVPQPDEAPRQRVSVMEGSIR